ncbi:SusE domain-containing protein [Flammeovirgaceae bacterium SG7u.111]|nr:SusE domain-containing protein [Flammeovirgaceae bacterium SG7u.132]WPO37779.1 SusE domain-containing protein [Flammeovirgaceae bacterium SG7u.111]
MKSNILYITLLFSLLFVWSCEEPENMQPEGQWELSNPEALSPASDASITLAEGGAIEFTWSPAVSSAKYGVRYTVVIDSANSADFDSPIVEIVADENGKGLTASISHTELDELLSYACYPANEIANLTWAVKAVSITKEAFSIKNIKVKRFEKELIPTQLYLTGEGTEAGADLSNAMPFRVLNNDQGTPSNKFEIYAQLVGGKNFELVSSVSSQSLQFGGSDGNLIKCGNPIEVEEDGVYRINIDFDANTYSLMKIDYISMVGGPIANGWGGDEPLEYQGRGLFSNKIKLLEEGSFVFRINGDWGYLFKTVLGTTNTVILESEAGDQGAQVEDCYNGSGVGLHTVTLDLSADAYSYTLEQDESAKPITAPETLFLLSENSVIAEFAKDGNTFTYDLYLPLEAGKTYTLNSESDGTGTAYAISSPLGQTDSPDGDKVTGAPDLAEQSGDIAVERDQAYQLTVDFNTKSVNWKYYNLKMFHWSDWDTRNEYLMTYEHPFKFNLTAELTAGHESKFNSPWDLQFGAGASDDASAMEGTMTNSDQSVNFNNISTSGTYDVAIEITSDYSTGTYKISK